MDRAGTLRLSLLVLVAGAASLATEVTGARMLAPYFGSSNIVWANIIGLTLLFLSIGYWIGGKAADKRPYPHALGLVALGAAAGIAVLPFVTQPLFDVATDAFDELSAGAFIGSFLGTLLLFAIPVTALGTVSPWAIRLAITDVREAGAVAGRLYALSTVGSIAGTFLPVLVLIPAIGSRRTLLVIAAALALAAALVVGRRWLLVPAGIALLAFLPAGTIKASDDQVLYEGESPYQFVQVVQRENGSRVLYLNEGWGQHSIWNPDTVLADGYWDAFLAMPLLTSGKTGRMALLGSAGGTTIRAMGQAWPGWFVDGVEIDPDVTAVGKRYLGLDENPNSAVHTADARVWLRRTDEQFDAIIVDAYRQPYIPFHLATREFFESAQERLTDEGVVAINVGTPPGEDAIVEHVAATMRDVFPAVLVSPYDDFNWILIGFQDPARAREAQARLDAGVGLTAPGADQLAATVRPAEPAPDKVMTDDHAPVESLTDTAILAYLREGAPDVSR